MENFSWRILRKIVSYFVCDPSSVRVPQRHKANNVIIFHVGYKLYIIKDNIKMIVNTATEFILGQMAKYTMVIGTMGSNTVELNLQHHKDMSEWDYGSTEIV